MKTVEKEKLWEEYQKNPSAELREKIIIEYAPLVRVVAGRLSMYLGYNVEYEDLVSYGIFGLIDAIDKFDRGKDVNLCKLKNTWIHIRPDKKNGLDSTDSAAKTQEN